MKRSIQERLRDKAVFSPAFCLDEAADYIDKLEAAMCEADKHLSFSDLRGLNDSSKARISLQAALPSKEPLKLCPFCGGEPEAMSNQGDFRYYKCKVCGAETSYCTARTEAEARKAWNQRNGGE